MKTILVNKPQQLLHVLRTRRRNIVLSLLELYS